MSIDNTEFWRPVKGFEGLYEISQTGITRSLERKVRHGSGVRTPNQRLLKTRVNNCGYLEVRLSKEGKAITKFIHVLLAQAFIPNSENKKEVNHKNGNKLDNSIDNLEWVTHAENVRHAYVIGLYNQKSKQAPVIDISTKKKFNSIKEAAEFNSIPYSTLKNYLNGNRKNPTNLTKLKAA